MATRLRLGMRVCAALMLACFSIPGADSYAGKVVAEIRFRPSPQPLTYAQLTALIPVRAGLALRSADIRESIQRLFATGEYADISVDATLVEGGVLIQFVTEANYFIGHVAVTGVPEPPNAGQLAIATKLRLGADYSPQDVRQAVESLADVTRRNGFYNPNIDPKITRHPGIQQVDIDFAVDPGKRAAFDGATVAGSPARSLKSIVNSTGWKSFWPFPGWRPVTENRVQSGLQSVRAWYPKHDHLLARVNLVSLDYHPSTNTVTPALAIESGPKVQVAVEGAKISGGKLRALLPVYQEQSVDENLLEEGARDLTRYLQAQGYFDARVRLAAGRQSSDTRSIRYEASRGARHKLVKVEIRGNRYFDLPALRERMYTAPASFRFRHGRYGGGSSLPKDLNAIRDLYRSNGFRDVEAASREVDNFQGKRDDIAVFIDVKEGPQWFVSKLDIEGVSGADRERLLSTLHSTAGQPYSDLNVATDRDNILDYFYNNGYPAARFDFASQPGAQPYRQELRFIVTPGRREYVRDVLVSGLRATDPDLVTQRISLKSGDPLSQNEITASQKRLYDLGIFARVGTAIQNPGGEEPTKYVLYSVEEARRYSMNVGFGAELGRIGGGAATLDSPAGAYGFSPRLSFGVDRLNFRGLGHTVGLQTRVSTLQQRALLTYLAPQFEGNADLSLQFSGLFDISRDVRTFSARREEGSVQLGQKLSRANSAQYRFVFRKVNILGSPLITPELIPLLSQPVREGLIGATFIQDRRDEPLDAHRGIYNTVDVGLSSKAFGSQNGFGRVLARNASYHRVTKEVVLARSTTFGALSQYSGNPDLPLPERFFSGGSSSQRAFPDNQAGPRDPTTGFPVGGKALFLNTVEFRFPLIGDDIGGVLFNDIGNVYTDLSSLSLRFRQRNLRDFDYGVHSYGFGIRYRTPIGPLRVDLSLSPNSPRFFGFRGTRNQLLFGGGEQVVQRINIFQFHFSLGQAF